MAAEDALQVQSCGELSVGDEIEAWHNGRLFHRGEVIRTVPATDLFWILDERTGTRRLIDAEALVIRRVAVPAGKTGPVAAAGPAARYGSVAGSVAGDGASGLPAEESPVPGLPASHVPLFQAPSLAS
ncbi:hypothetical protein J2X01_002763 [Arthrobacter ginsengisoli]|uniref:Uncharacterized protein n=1 Tax=Arthrobacter ginsengisoli TaxID=1356565 RepID=A0ABU1UE43_9MICC|nr:hypothetical protein [Arthrobacter ginsengisoli]MDR7083469.1 hypothetical protein [Arthrobacter ginsengisoli]